MSKSSTDGSLPTAGTPRWKPSERIYDARGVGAILNVLLHRLDAQIGQNG